MDRNTQDGGEAILEAFRNLGVDYIMSSPGSEWGPLWEALARQEVGNKARFFCTFFIRFPVAL